MLSRGAKVTKERAFRKGDMPSRRHFPKGVHSGPSVMAGYQHLCGQIVCEPAPAWTMGRPCLVRDERLFLQLSFQDLDFLGQRHIVTDQAFDLAHGVQNRRVVTPAEAPANFGQRAQG